MEQEQTLNELITSLNSSIEDIRQHPTKVDRIPSNFEIMVRGISSSSALDMLFSPKIDDLLNNLFKQIETGNFDKILSNQDSIEQLMTSLFGEGSFKGPVSQSVLNSISATVQSRRYQEMKSNLGKSMVALKKVNLVLKNLQKNKKQFKDKPEEYKKYKDAVYAIKQVLKFAARIYRNRKIINKKVFDGLNNIVHENFDFEMDNDEMLY